MTVQVTGINAQRLQDLEDRVRREVDDGLLPACQYAVAKDGEIVAQATFGDATDSTRFAIFSSTKAISVSAFWILLGDGNVSIDQRVADILPSFAANGKQDITIEQVLLHTAGFPNAPLGPPEWRSHGTRVERYAGWRLDWEPGSMYAYHHSSAHWVLMDILTAITGADHRDFIRERILEPLGLKAFALGIPPSGQTGIADVVYVGEDMTPDELEAAFGIREIPAPEGSLQAIGDFALLLNESEAREVGIPGGGAYSTAADVALFYQGLLRNDQGIWDPEVLADGTARVRNTFPDLMTGASANRALGTVVAGDDGKANLRGFGKTFSPRAFGHGGAGGQIAVADPTTGVSFCYVTNGHDRHMIRQARRGVGIASRAGLVTLD